MVEDHVLELGREVDLRAVVRGKVPEELRREGRRSVLDSAREAVLLTRHLRDGAERLEVDLDALNGAVRADDASVGAARLDGDLGDPFSAAELPEVAVHVRAELLRSRVRLAHFPDLASDRDGHVLRLPLADESGEPRRQRRVDRLLLFERRLREVHESRRVDVDLEEARGDRLIDQGLDGRGLLVRIVVHLLRVRLEVVPLQEDGTLPLLADRSGENDGCVLAGPLVRVADLATRDLENQSSDPEVPRSSESGPGRVVGEHSHVDGGDRETPEFRPASRLVERKDRGGSDAERGRCFADCGARRLSRVAPPENGGPHEAVESLLAEPDRIDDHEPAVPTHGAGLFELFFHFRRGRKEVHLAGRDSSEETLC